MYTKLKFSLCAFLFLVTGCSSVSNPVLNDTSDSSPTLTSSEQSSLTCHAAVMQLLSQDGYTKKSENEMIWTRGGRTHPQVIIDFTNRFLQLNDPEFSYEDLEVMKREEFETEEEYQTYLINAYALYKYDAAEERFLDFTIRVDDGKTEPKVAIENEMRGIYEKYVADSGLLGCGSIDGLPWRRFEQFKNKSASPIEGILHESTEVSANTDFQEPIDMLDDFIEVETIEEFLSLAKEKFIPAYENIGKATQMNSFKRVGFDLLIMDSENINQEIASDEEISPRVVLDYIRDHYFEKSEFAGDYLVFLRLKEGDLDKIKENLPNFDFDDVMTLLTIPVSKDGTMVIEQSLSNNTEIMAYLNESLGFDAKPSYELLDMNQSINEDWQKLFGLD